MLCGFALDLHPDTLKQLRMCRNITAQCPRVGCRRLYKIVCTLSFEATILVICARSMCVILTSKTLRCATHVHAKANLF